MAIKTSGNRRAAFEANQKLARIGSPEAQYELGLMYANGMGIKQNIPMAIHWITQAARKGLAAAQYLLGTRFENGAGVEQSAHWAIHWYQQAAEQGHTKAMYRLSVLYGVAQSAQAAVFLRQSANAGLSAAQCALGKAYLHGETVERDRTLGLEWLERAAAQNLDEAQFALGDALLQGHPDAATLEQAIFWLRKAARQDYLAAQVTLEEMERSGTVPLRTRGSAGKRAAADRRRREDRWILAAEKGPADSKFQLAKMYDEGLGVSADTELARHWYSQAALQGHPEAQFRLGQLLMQQGSMEAEAWYRRAAEAGHASAQFALGSLVKPGPENLSATFERLEWWSKAAIQRDAHALTALGNWFADNADDLAASCYLVAAGEGQAHAQFLLAQHLERSSGDPARLTTAMAWYRQAAQGGSAGAQHAVGMAHLTGRGANKDVKEALRWLVLAAEQGHAAAQWNLGVVYTTGLPGLKRNLKTAVEWLKRSAKQGFVAAQANLGILYALSGAKELAVATWSDAAAKNDPEALFNLALAYIKGDGVQKDENLGFELLCRSANLGIVPAQARLGLMYLTGEIAVQDPIEGLKWLALASEAGDQAARSNLQRAMALCSPKQVAEGQRRAKEWKSGVLAATVSRSKA